MHKRGLDILKILLETKEDLSYKYLSDFFEVNERTIRYDVEKINEVLEENSFPPILKKSKGIIHYEDIDILKKVIDFLVKEIDPSYTKDELVLFKILFLGRINLRELSDEFQISRTNIKNILKHEREQLKNYGLSLEIETQKGLILTGKEENIRRYQVKFLAQYSKDMYVKENIQRFYSKIDRSKIKIFLDDLIKTTGYLISDEPYKTLLNYLTIMVDRVSKGNTLETVENKNFFMNLQEYRQIDRSIKKLEESFQMVLNENEKARITDYFLGSHCYSPEKSRYNFWIEIDLLAKKMIKIFSDTVGISLENDSILLEGIVNHLKPTIHRLRNNLTLENSILEDFLKLYHPIFLTTKKASSPLRDFIDMDITDDEIAFLGTHFKAALDRNSGISDTKCNLLVVCSSGYGTSKLLSQQINENFIVDIKDIIPSYKLDNYDLKGIDMVLTTLDIEISLEKPVVTVNPILSKEDREFLENVGLQKKKTKVLLSKILDIIGKTCTVEKEKDLQEGLKLLLGNLLINDIQKKDLHLSELIGNRIFLQKRGMSWEKAVQESGILLMEDGWCDETYIHSMVEKINEFGSYMTMDNMLAIPHSRNEGNVFKTGMSLISFDEEIIFPNNISVKTILTFTSIDGVEHLEALSNFLDLVNNYGFLDRLKENIAPKKIMDIIKKYEFLSKLGK